MTKRRIKKFISSSIEYRFPNDQTSLSWNFANLSPKVTKMPGMSGGFDEYLGGPAPSETGNINIGWKLISSTWAGLRAMKDAARAIASSEEGYLFVIPEDQQDESRGLRWVETRLNNMSVPENAAAGTSEQAVTAQFQAVNPVWYGCEPTTDTSEPVYNRRGWLHFDDDLVFDTSGLIWGGARVVQSGIGNGTQVTCTNRGNHVTLPLIRIIGGAVATTIGVRRLHPKTGVIQEAFEWQGAIAATERLVVDCKQATVTVEDHRGDINAYETFSVVSGPGFIELMPGNNILEFYGDISGLSLEVYYPDAWY
jgi:hypothetical protein